jgi:hypothetical protein
MALCEYVTEVADKEARELVRSQYDIYFHNISDAIIQTAEEYEP